MDLERVWSDLASLPAEAQQQAADFIAYLREQYGAPGQKQPAQPTDLADEPFVGMWRDREDMQDSSQWVRESRKHEWS